MQNYIFFKFNYSYQNSTKVGWECFAQTAIHVSMSNLCVQWITSKLNQVTQLVFHISHQNYQRKLPGKLKTISVQEFTLITKPVAKKRKWSEYCDKRRITSDDCQMIVGLKHLILFM